MSYKVGFRAFGNLPMFADSFSVVSTHCVARKLRQLSVQVANYECEEYLLSRNHGRRH